MPASNLSNKEIAVRLSGIVSLRRGGDEQRYISELTGLYRLAPEHPRVARRYVRALIDRGLLDEARSIALAQYEASPNAYLAWDLVDLSSRVGDEDLVLRFANELNQFVEAGFSDYDAQRYKAIIEQFWHLDGIKLKPKPRRAAGKPPAGDAKASAQAPTTAELRRTANRLARDGRFHDLLDMLQASPQAKNDPAVRLLCSAAHYATGQDNAAMEDVNFVIASGEDPFVARAHMRRANFLRNAGRNLEAIDDYRTLRKMPSAAGIGYERAMFRTLRAIGLGTTVDRYVRAAGRAHAGGTMNRSRYMQLQFDADRQYDLTAIDPSTYHSEPRALTLGFRALLEVGRYHSAWLFLQAFHAHSESLSAFIGANDKPVMDLCAEGLVRSDDAILEFGVALLKALKALRADDDVKPHCIMLSASSLGIGGCERQLLTLSKYAREHVPDATLMAYVWLPKEQGYRIKHDLRILGQEDAANLEPIRWRGAEVTVMGKRFSAEEALSLVATIFRTANLDGFLRLAQHERPQVIHYAVGSIVDFIVATYLSNASRILVQLGSRYLADQASGSDIFNRVIETTKELIACAQDDERFQFAINSVAAAESWAENTGLEVGDFEIIYNGVDDTFLHNVSASSVDAMRSRLGLKSDGRVVGGVFRMHAIKDPYLWVRTVEEVLKRDPRATAVLVGDGALWQRVAAMIGRSPLRERIRIYGAAHDELPTLYRCMDVLLVTSRSESLPNTVLEAQAQGTLIVSVNVGGIAEAVTLGSLVDSRDSRELATAVIATMAEQGRRTERIRQCRKFLRSKFGADIMVEKTFSCYGLK